MHEKVEMVAVCGLECHKCDIFQAVNDPQIAKKVADWFKKERNEEVKLEDIHCLGCRGDRSKHWSPDCWILKCCVDTKGLQFCYQCEQFPCEKLIQWSNGGERYKQALDRLKAMRKG